LRHSSLLAHQSAADAYLQKHNASHLVPRGSWEYEMLGYCRTRLAAKPARAEALLFYSQHPDGRPDLLSTHGGCPVIKVGPCAGSLCAGLCGCGAD
jgi:hypothetical protein